MGDRGGSGVGERIESRGKGGERVGEAWMKIRAIKMNYLPKHLIPTNAVPV